MDKKYHLLKSCAENVTCVTARVGENRNVRVVVGNNEGKSHLEDQGICEVGL
jgi:hypothetical protein